MLSDDQKFILIHSDSEGITEISDTLAYNEPVYRCAVVNAAQL